MMTSAQIIKEKTENARARSNIYKLLSIAFFKELSPESISIFARDNIKETLKDLDIDFGKEFYSRGEDKLLKELTEEYAALFILPGGVNPTESVARSGLYMQVFASQAAQFYKKCGFTLPDDFKGFPDHIGIELEFMSHLAESEANACKKGREDEAKKWIEFQKKFLQEHISQWALTFAQNVATYTRQLFYREMARLLYEFIRLEAVELSVEIEGL